jgi:hypothetical protein
MEKGVEKGVEVGSSSKCRRRSPCEKDIVSARPALAKVLCGCLIKPARLQIPKTNSIYKESTKSKRDELAVVEDQHGQNDSHRN